MHKGSYKCLVKNEINLGLLHRVKIKKLSNNVLGHLIEEVTTHLLQEEEGGQIITNGSQEEVINLKDTTQGGHIKEAAIVVQEGHHLHIIHGVAGTRLEDGHINANN